MPRTDLLLGTLAALSSASGVALADKVFLSDGAVVEGKATRKGDRVIVRLEAGEVGFPADSVERIEKGTSALSEFENRRAALRPGDVGARLALADYCRSHDMPSSEREILREVIVIDPDHSAARERLGYVKADGGWVTHADAMRARGLVLMDGKWVTPTVVEASERRRSEQDATARKAERAEAELRAMKARLASEEMAREERPRRWALEPRVSYFAPYYPFYRTIPAYAPVLPAAAAPTPSPWASWNAWESSMSVVKTPYRRGQ